MKGPDCNVGLLIARLDPREADTLRRHLVRPRADVPDAQLARAIKTAYGLQIGTGTISRHRKQLCQCETRGIA